MNKSITLNNLFKALENAEPDPKVGIKVAHLSGNDEFSLFVAEIAPNKMISAHYHEKGDEIYFIFEGKGLMYLSKTNENKNIKWEKPFNLNSGDSFNIKEGYAHQLFNNTENKMIAIFGCSRTHLSSDRLIVD